MKAVRSSPSALTQRIEVIVCYPDRTWESRLAQVADTGQAAEALESLAISQIRQKLYDEGREVVLVEVLSWAPRESVRPL